VIVDTPRNASQPCCRNYLLVVLSYRRRNQSCSEGSESRITDDATEEKSSV